MLPAVLTAPRASWAEIWQITITGTVDFVGCPSAISCPAFPGMWGISGGEPMTARLTYDDESPLAFLDDQSPDFVSARYDHTLPLSSPLGVEVASAPTRPRRAAAAQQPAAMRSICSTISSRSAAPISRSMSDSS